MRWDAEVTGSKATMSCANFGVPHNGNFIIVKDTEGNELLKESVDSGGAKNAVKSHFMLKAIILPRQARDKHRESSQKEARVWQATLPTT